jgi:aminopeptidase N
MEFPMMTNVGSFKYPYWIHVIHTHELAHTYFPNYVGTNEKKYAWIDEGFAAFLTLDFLKLKNLEYYTPTAVMVYEEFAGSEWDCPLLVPSYLKSGESLSTPSYNKSLIAFNILKDLVGSQKFYQIIENFILEWAGKHPISFDLFFFIENQYGEKLDWFWIPWFQNVGYPDLKINSVQNKNGLLNIEIERIGDLPLPINLIFRYGDGTKESFTAKADIWKYGKVKHVLQCKVKEDAPLEMIELNPHYIPDSNRDDNTFSFLTSENDK